MNDLIKISEEQLVTVKVVKSIFTISIQSHESNEKIDITGISILPQLFEIKPTDIRNSIIDKANAAGGVDAIENEIRKGIYFVNIRDYTANEIRHLAKHVTDKMLSEIWSLLISDKEKPFTTSLKDRKVKEIILEENADLFKNENDFDNFCLKYGLTVKTFIEPANFSELEIKLKETEARFDLEQFYARRFLFCSLLIEKLKSRINEYTANGNQIVDSKLKLLNSWIIRMNQKLSILKDFNNYYKLYDMPNLDNKIEIKDSNNVNIIGGNVSDSKIIQTKNKDSKSDKRFSKRIGIWTIVLMAIGTVVSIIINWDKNILKQQTLTSDHCSQYKKTKCQQ